jgi:7-carboxy-7-deazaguanine synthase
VELTGGEPLAQKGSVELCQELISSGFKVMIETSGSYDISTLPNEVHIVMDIKCPDSGMESKNLYDNLTHIKQSDDVKFVVASYEDFLWADSFVRDKKLDQYCNVLVSPAFGLVKPEELVSWMLETKLNARLNLQIHKYIWSPRKKGV